MRNLLLGFCMFALGTGCSDDDTVAAPDEEARREVPPASISSIAKALNLGFAGFNAATNANIPIR